MECDGDTLWTRNPQAEDSDGTKSATDLDFFVADSSGGLVNVTRDTLPITYEDETSGLHLSNTFQGDLRYFYEAGCYYFYFRFEGDVNMNGNIVDMRWFIELGYRFVFLNLPPSQKQYDGTPDNPPNYAVFQTSNNHRLNNKNQSVEYEIWNVQDIYFQIVMPDRVHINGNITIADEYAETLNGVALIARGDTYELIYNECCDGVLFDSVIVFSGLPPTESLPGYPHVPTENCDDAPNGIELTIIGKSSISKKLTLSNPYHSRLYTSRPDSVRVKITLSDD